MRKIITALVAGGITIGALFCYFCWPFLVLLLIGIASRELVKALERARLAKPLASLLMFGIVGIVLIAWFLPTSYSKLMPVYLSVSIVIALLVELLRYDRAPIKNAFCTIACMIYLGLPASFMILMWHHSSSISLPDGTLLILSILILNCTTDIGAWAFGPLVGGSKICETISPKKTWRGSFAGLVCAMAMSIVLVGWLGQVNALVMGVIAGVCAPTGDLIESAIKREIRVKDLGTILPGHGGILDRIDSLLVTITGTFSFLTLTGQL